MTAMESKSTAQAAADSFHAGGRAMRDRRVRDAAQFFMAAERLGHPAEECAARLWQCWMHHGDFERAWQESDRILAMQLHDPHRFWTGEPWHGKHVMLRCLHGLGDTIQFIRYAPLLRAKARSLTVQVHPQLVRLIDSVAGVDRTITWDEQEGDWDIQMEVIELPRAFRSSISSIPAEVPYLHASRELACRTASSRLRIGLHWEAGPWDASRSIPIESFAPLISDSAHDFYCLQKGVDARDIGIGLHDLEVFADDIYDTAGLIMGLDLVISADTMSAHLAGALGKPVWVLLPFEADWRWMLNRCDSPWYPTMRLFRQPEQGEWQPVLNDVGAALKLLES